MARNYPTQEHLPCPLFFPLLFPLHPFKLCTRASAASNLIYRAYSPRKLMFFRRLGGLELIKWFLLLKPGVLINLSITRYVRR